MYYISTNYTVVAITRQNGTCSLLTSAKLSIGYLVVEITRELDKESSLHCSSIYINTMWSMLQQYLLALMSMPLPHVLLLRPPCHIHMPWHHTLNFCCTCVHYVYTMRNPCLLMLLLILTLFRLFPILPDFKFFQTTLDYSSFYHMTSRSYALPLL